MIYTYFKRGELINRGFLKAPLCPIYGFGILLIVSLVTGIESVLGMTNHILDFTLVVFVTTGLELITGRSLEVLFMTKWWDYSSNPFNYKGYICLKFSLLWGLIGMLVLKTLHPLVIMTVNKVPLQVGLLLVVGMTFMFLVDIAFTVKALIDFRNLLYELEKVMKDYRQAKEKLLTELENRIQELEEPVTKFRAEINKLNIGVHASKDKFKEEFGKLGEDLSGIKNRLNHQKVSLQKNEFFPNGAMRDFLNKRLDLEKRLKRPFKTNIHDLYNHFHKLTGKLSRNRFIKSFPEMQSHKFKSQLRMIRAKSKEEEKLEHKHHDK
ncbi:putative ABC transporter permease [Fusibacter sp. JL216-2]|uniref:putative ABC transporter permease n=1 Tax=Fusibacter sp. JL216-2 TaxID=3071453 RepID=UPI003D3531C1